MKFKDIFLEAINNRQKIQLVFFSKEDNANLTRICAPFDIGPSRRAKDKSDRYHVWDYDSDTERHVLSLLDVQVVSITVLEEQFDPADIIS